MLRLRPWYFGVTDVCIWFPGRELKELRAGRKACNLLLSCPSVGFKRNTSFSKYQLFRFIGSWLNVK